MAFMSFLRKFGAIALQAGEVAAGIAPIAQLAYPGQAKEIATVSRDIAQIASVVQQVEVFGQALALAGPDKLKAAAPAVAQIVLQSSIVADHEIGDPELFKQGCTKVADGFADILNSLKG